MRVLAIGAHPDDVELGCGGTLARHVMEGDEARILHVGYGRSPDPVATVQGARSAATALGIKDGPVQARSTTTALGVWIPLILEDQQFDMVPLLHIVQRVEQHLAGFRPDVVYTHHIGDRNLDHRIVADAVFTACRPVPGCSVKRLLSFEVPSSTEWGSGFEPNVFVDISGEPGTRKMAALDCYGAEIRPAPHARSMHSIVAREFWRGASAGVTAAEAFMLIREVR